MGLRVFRGHLLDQPGAKDRQVDDLFRFIWKTTSPLQGRGRIVEMDDGLPAPESASKVFSMMCWRDWVSTWIGHIVRNQPAGRSDDAGEVVFRSEADGKPISIVLKPISTSCLEHPQLLLQVHRVFQSLVAVAQVDAAPERGPGYGRDGQVRSARSIRGKGGISSLLPVSSCSP